MEISRDVDEGISIPHIDTLIEVDFLYGIGNQSKKNRRLLQGRVETANQHILMTESSLYWQASDPIQECFLAHNRGVR